MINIIPKPNKVLSTGILQKYRSELLRFETDSNIKPEGYRIIVSPDSILIASSDDDGKYYAQLTLSQLIKDGNIVQCIIEDEPLYSYRGFMLDSSRHMQTIEEIKRFIKAASLFKYNYFHWHLSDDQGFRIESEKYPFLNKVGSYRRSIGFNNKGTDTYGGYYTKDEIKDIVSYCESLHIQVIPELDIPGHTSSWLASYANLGCKNENVQVKIYNGVKTDVLCAGKDTTYEFCYNIIDEVAELFPCKYFHIGGDEVPKHNWKNCPDCQKMMKTHKLKNEEQLQGYFTSKIIDHLSQIGKVAIGWNEVLNSGMIKDNIITANWNDPKKKVKKFANNGGKVIAEDMMHNYIDLAYSLVPMKSAYDYNIYPSGVKKQSYSNFIGIETPLWTEWISDYDKLCFMSYPRMMAVAENCWTKRENKNYSGFKQRVKEYVKILSDIGISVAPESYWDPNPAMKVQLNIQWQKNFKINSND